MAASLRRWARRRHAELYLLQYRQRGWNDPDQPSPVADARWAVDQVAQRRPDVAILVVGHSMGGRTACRIADEPRVQGVVALAPWLPDREPISALIGTPLTVMHGTADTWTSPQLSRAFVERLRAAGSPASWTALDGVGHFMFRHVSTWRRFVEDSLDSMMRTSSADQPGPIFRGSNDIAPGRPEQNGT